MGCAWGDAVDGETSVQAAGASLAGATRVRARRLLSASQWIAVLAMLAVGATMITAAIGYEMARRSDERLLTEQRASLRNAMAEFRGLFGRSGSLDPGFVRMVEQNAGLLDLKFETNPASSGREMQPAIDAQGRIAGFFTWDRIHPMTDTMNRLMPLIAGIAIVLVIFAGFALGMLRRARNELAASEEQAQRVADHDKLTGLPNHAKMLEQLDLALTERAASEITSFVLIEIDGMADIDAQLGLLGSEDVIAAAADVLRQALPAGAELGRIGSDKFAITITGEDEVEPAIRVALDALARPVTGETAVRISAYAGFAQAPRHATTRSELTRRSDLALRAAAEKGPGSIVVFDMSLDAASADHKFITRELPRALEANELELHYQPIVAANGGRMVGVEALLRWTHPVRGAIGPAVFIPIAERMGLMDALGAFVLRRALQEARRWPDLYIAVNLSPLQVRDSNLIELVRAALTESGVAPERLVLEITEGVLIDNPDEMVQRIEELHALGVSVALDDFGSGYSNLGYLQRFPLDKLKIDRSFVAGLGTSANGGVIIQAIVALGRALGLTVLVEGVETEQQRVLLRLAGCDEMQGYLFAKPAPARAIDRLLAQVKQGRTAGALTG